MNRLLSITILTTAIVNLLIDIPAYGYSLQNVYKNSQEFCDEQIESYADPTAANLRGAYWECTEDYFDKFAPELKAEYLKLSNYCNNNFPLYQYKYCMKNEMEKLKVTPSTIYKNHVNSMVYIKTQNMLGSGVIVKEDGTIVTCFHVIENADYIDVKTHDGRTFKVNGFKYINPTDDVAILTIDAPYNKFTPIDINNNKLQVGEQIYTISNPQGLEFTFSDGMVNQYKNEYIQFSAPISPGSSGGALLNEKGQLIGIITSQLTQSQNINFALPNNYYAAQINNLPLKNIYNQNWTKFLLSQTGNSQFKLTLTPYKNNEEQSAESLYNSIKDYVGLPNFPPRLYTNAGCVAFYAYFETSRQDILNNAIKWFELSIKHGQNFELSFYALVMLYAINNENDKFERCRQILMENYPESAQVFLTLPEGNMNKGKIYLMHFEKLIRNIQ